MYCITPFTIPGFIIPGVYTFPGVLDVGFDVYSNTNPMETFSTDPKLADLQILMFII